MRRQREGNERIRIREERAAFGQPIDGRRRTALRSITAQMIGAQVSTEIRITGVRAAAAARSPAAHIVSRANLIKLIIPTKKASPAGEGERGKQCKGEAAVTSATSARTEYRVLRKSP